MPDSLVVIVWSKGNKTGGEFGHNIVVSSFLIIGLLLEFNLIVFMIINCFPHDNSVGGEVGAHAV